MRIRSIEIKALQAQLNQPFRIATGQHDTLDNLLVSLTLEDGTTGFGEAAVASHITGETLDKTRENLLTAASCLKDFLATDYLRISNWLHDSFPRNKSVVAAIETALLDALTSQMGVPLWRIFGSVPKQLTSDITIVIASLEETQQKAEEFYRQGFRAFKIKVGKDMDLDFKRVQAIATTTPGSSLIIDANQGYDSTQTLQFLTMLDTAGINIDLIEQPTVKGDIEGLKRIKASSKVIVCADESAASITDVLRLIKEKAVDAINIKLMKTGLIHSFEIARLAKASGLKLMIGGMMESNVAMSAAAHLASGFGDFDFVDLDTPFLIKDEAARNPYLSSSGVYDLSKAEAGIGIDCHPRMLQSGI